MPVKSNLHTMAKKRINIIMENNIFNMLSLLSGQFGNNSNNSFSQAQNSTSGQNSAQNFSNRQTTSFPEEAYSNTEQTASTQSFNNPDASSGMMPLLMQMMGGKGGMGNLAGLGNMAGMGHLGGLDSIMKNGNFDMSSLFSSQPKTTKKEGVAPKDDIIL